MPKSKKRLDNQNQLTIFEFLNRLKDKEAIEGARAGSLQIDIEFRELVSEVLKKCPYSRYHVAARMSELTGEEVTKSMLDTWTAESKENHRFPAKYLHVFCIATNNFEVLEYLCRKAGLFVLPGAEALRAEIRRIEEEIEKKKREKRKRVMFLDEIEGRVA